MTKEDLLAKIEIVKALKCSSDCNECSKYPAQCLKDLRSLVGILFRLICKKDTKSEKENIVKKEVSNPMVS